MILRVINIGHKALRTMSTTVCIGWLLGLCAFSALADEQPTQLFHEISAIDARSPGQLGVYIKHLGTGGVIDYQADRTWYLASTVKVPVAIAVLQAVEQGQLSLSDEVVLKQSHFVDGAGDLLWHKPGTRFTLETLLKKSLRDSDSTATDMLIEQLGEQALNDQIQDKMVAQGFEPITSILQVRFDAYGELHPHASRLTNMDYVELKSAGGYDARVQEFMRKLDLEPDDLQVSSLEEAFERYYERDINAATLTAFGQLLERLVCGELLNEAHTDLLLKHMEKITTGDRRLKAGLPADAVFAQKTGTQVERACNMGVINPRSQNAVVIASCMEDFGSINNAERTFKQLAGRLQWAGLLQAQ